MDQPGSRPSTTEILDGRISTGIPGLDIATNGGLPAGAAYLVRGGPGSGKTTLGLQFLSAGVQAGDTAMFITLGEREDRLSANVPADIDISGIEFLDLSPSASAFTSEESYDVFASHDVEGKPIMDAIRAAVDSTEPARVVIDSMSHLRHLAVDEFQYRKRMLGLLRLLIDQNATVIATSEATSTDQDADLSFLCDGVIELTAEKGARRLTIPKLRGTDAAAGPHTYTLTDQGVRVSTRLKAAEHLRPYSADLVGSGIAALDEMCGGGFHRGTTTVISGPSGVGKSNVGMVFMKEAASRGERSVVVSFEESRDMLMERCRSINIPVDGMVDHGMLSVHSLGPLSHTPDQLAELLREEVESHKARIVMLDSLSSFRLSVAGDENLIERLHEISRYLGNMGVTLIIVDETDEVTGGGLTSDRLSFISDNIVLLRYIKGDEGLERIAGMLKKRTGDFRTHPMRFSITSSGLRFHETDETIDRLIPGLREH